MLVTIFIFSMAVASISLLLTETTLLLPVREWVKRKNAPLGELFSCGYCFGHWVALILVAVYKPRQFFAWWPLDYVLTALVIAWIAGFQWALMCLFMEKAGK